MFTSIVNRLRVNQRRLSVLEMYKDMEDDKQKYNHMIGEPLPLLRQALSRLFFKGTGKTILLMPYLMALVGIANFLIIQLIVAFLGYLKMNLVIETSINQGFYNYGLLMKKAFRPRMFLVVSILECLCCLFEYLLIITQIYRGILMLTIIIGSAGFVTLAICILSHLCFLLPRRYQSILVSFFQYLSFILIFAFFMLSVIRINEAKLPNMNNLFYFNVDLSKTSRQKVLYFVYCFSQSLSETTKRPSTFFVYTVKSPNK